MVISIVTVSLFVIGLLLIVANVISEFIYHKIKDGIWLVRINNFNSYSMLAICVIIVFLLVTAQFR